MAMEGRNCQSMMFNSKEEFECFLSKKRYKKDMGFKDLYNISSDKVLELSGQTNAVPVDLKKILKTFDISAMPKDFTEVDEKIKTIKINGKTPDIQVLGVFVSNDDNAAIFYNDKYKEDSHRCRFTIAHELAHCCLQADGSHIECRMAGIEPDDDELAANTFAGALLIPENSLNRVIDELIVPSVLALADIFEVSENVMKARLKYLNIQKNILGYNY